MFFLKISLWVALFHILVFGKMQMRIMKTSILSCAPCLKLHHLVLLSKNGNTYSIDFTPIEAAKPNTLAKLLSGQDVAAEIRLRHFARTNINDDSKIMTIWNAPITAENSQKISAATYKKITDGEIKKLVAELLSWKCENVTMNLYTSNCQHFSKFALTKIISNYE